MDKNRRNFLIAAIAGGFATLSGYVMSKKTAIETHQLIQDDVIETQTTTKLMLKESIKSMPQLGINLTEVSYYGTEWPLVDLYKYGKVFDVDQTVKFDEYGEVKEVVDGKGIKILLRSVPENAAKNQYFKSGKYVLLYEGQQVNYPLYGVKKGENTLVFNGAAKLITENPLVIEVDSSQTLIMEIWQLHPTKPIRNIRLLPVEAEKSYLTNPWEPRFLELLDGFSSLRFMDTMHTNASSQSAWSNRPKNTDIFLGAEKGLSLELMVDLANRKEINPWFCIPHLADDSYVKAFANYLKENLNTKLKAYIEYSNETWNWGFPQTTYAKEQAISLGFGADPNLYAAFRSVQIFDIFEQVYGESRASRIVRVMASQAAWDQVSKNRLSFKNAHEKTDVLAVAPYISLLAGPELEFKIQSWTLDDLFIYLNKTALPESVAWMNASKAVADQFGKKLVAYEGGQHLVGITGVENNQKITDLFLAANKDPRMEAIYSAYMKAWADAGGDLFCHFNSIGPWSKWGAWSLLQSKYEPLKESPKWQAVAKWANSLGQKIRL